MVRGWGLAGGMRHGVVRGGGGVISAIIIIIYFFVIVIIIIIINICRLHNDGYFGVLIHDIFQTNWIDVEQFMSYNTDKGVRFCMSYISYCTFVIHYYFRSVVYISLFDQYPLDFQKAPQFRTRGADIKQRVNG